MSERECPGCGQGMMAARMGPLALDLCRSCQGVWFDYGELPQLVQAGAPIVRRLASALAGPARAGRSSRCPVCRVPLSGADFRSLPGVELQTCPFCEGFWVLAAALERIAALLEKAAQAAPAVKPGAPGAYLSVPTRNDFRPPPQATPSPPPSAPAPLPDVYAEQRERFSSWQQLAAEQAAAKAAPEAKAGKTYDTAPRRGRQGKSEAAGEECPDCGEGNAVGAPVCWACGTPLRGKIEGKCPRCAGALRRMESAGVRLAACEGCGGAWVEDGRLSALVIQPREVQDVLIGHLARNRTGRIRKLEQQLVCPIDSLFMVPTPFGMLSTRPIDTCPQCRASFLDSGVLEEILRAQRR